MQQVRAAGAASAVGTRGLKRHGITALWWLTGILLAALFLMPLASAVFGSFKSRRELQQSDPGLLPEEISFESWVKLLDPNEGVLSGVLNSIIVSSLTVVFALVASIFAGYGLARFRFRISGLVFAILIAGMMIPVSVLLTPISVVLRDLGLSNSLLGVSLVYATFQLPFCVFIMRNALEAIPNEVEEAAMLDGCTRVQVFRLVFLPLSVPGIVSAAIFAFLNAWNEFIAALALLTDQARFTLPVLLQTKQIGRFGAIDWGMLNAGVVLSMIPCLLLFFLLQRHYVNGVFSGMVK
jgi:multiple sugar transport system permease protein